MHVCAVALRGIMTAAQIATSNILNMFLFIIFIDINYS